MVHVYKNNGYNLALDVNSGCVHVIDDVVYDLIPVLGDAVKEKKTEEELLKIAEQALEKHSIQKRRFPKR